MFTVWVLLVALLRGSSADLFTLSQNDDALTDIEPDSEGKMQADPGYYKPGKGRYGDIGGINSGHGYLKKTGSFHNAFGECGKLIPPMNSAMTCSSSGVCLATCLTSHQFPNGETSIHFVCQDGRWRGRELPSESVPQCSPTCLPACQNSGSCISPNVCQCSGNFFGAYCQYEKKPCYDFPSTPMNSRKACSAETCTVECAEGHVFPDGSSLATVICKDGEWLPSRKEWVTIPDCQAVCSPPCQNGGNCLSYNMCQCPQEFRGPQCQYTKEICDVRKLGFNGNYNCSGNELTFNCRVHCPSGMVFSTPPASVYTCRYDSGEFEPRTVPQCIFTKNMLSYVFEDENEHGASETEFVQLNHKSSKNSKHTKTQISSDSKYKVREEKKPSPGMCLTWKKEHFKTFDGKLISFKSGCVYTLVTNIDNTFHIQTPALKKNCDPKKEKCSYINLYVNDKNYQLIANDSGRPIIQDGDKKLSVPSQIPGMRVELGSKSIKANLQASGVTLVWNLANTLEIRVSESNWNKTTGLCGRLDGYNNDLLVAHENLQEYASLSKVVATEDVCDERIIDTQPCTDAGMQQKAQEFCSKLLNSKKFSSCNKVISSQEYYQACMWDYCSCDSEKSEEDCGCETMAMFLKDCTNHDVKIQNWRDETLCPMRCTEGRVYSECGSETPCGSTDREFCEEGCFCPPGTYVHNDTCLPQKACPCSLRGKLFKPGEAVPNDCNTCTCIEGAWSCTNVECGARCEAVGDPHYKTFDKRTFDFMGKCSYYLLQTNNYSIETENVPCDGTISEDLGYSLYTAPDMPSCTKTVTIRLGETVIKLKQNYDVTVNGEEHKLPVSLKEGYIRQASSLFVLVELNDGVEVWWDGTTRVYINVPPIFKGKTKGLCGTFNGNQKDDFLTPEGDVEQDATSFANKWKTKESCDIAETIEGKHPCDVNVQNKAEAEKICSEISSHIFLDCHFFVDPATYYQNCLYDMCSCRKKKHECYCPILAAYAKECARQGVPIEWRSKVRECGLRCPRGQVYDTCGKSCSRSCQDLSRRSSKKCADQGCLEGCNCPSGLALDHRGVCISIAECPCTTNGLQYPPGHAEIRPATKGLELCSCKSAQWECHSASKEELKKYPNNSLEATKCSATRNQVYSHCEPPEPVTCQNMHSANSEVTPAICYGGCVCKRGYVLDSISKECVRPDECPCHHGGRSFKDGAKMQEDCNTCVCNMGKWTCTDHVCPGVCTTWGDSHFKTFDDNIFDFQGTCDYVLAKGALSPEESFIVVIEMVPCGTSGVSCSKSVKLTVGSNDQKEQIVFANGKGTPSSPNNNRILQREAGLFLFADVSDLGLVLQWDRGTRLMVRADPKWKGKIKGLCGNYNDDQSDDFQTPSGGISEVSAQLFGDSWKLYDYCPKSEPIKDTCGLRPNRKAWAVEKCSILKSSLFKSCHSEVPLDAYMERCIFDSCACDQGGDCECLCTAIAAYAQECNSHGVPIKWRSQELCPLQCDESCSQYSPCVQTCPPETCDNILKHKNLMKMCGQDICVEGCKYKPCLKGEVYSNSSKQVCIPESMCKPVCMVINGTTYNEGDLMEGDGCYSCFCSRHKKICSGQPCTTPAATTSTEEPTIVTAEENSPRTAEDHTEEIGDDTMKCVGGWSKWANKHHPVPGKVNKDVEPLPLFTDFGKDVLSIKKGKKKYGARCPIENMVNIECRTVNTHIAPKKTGEDVECSLERGLYCQNGCSDYEIRVYCECGTPTTRATTVKPTKKRTTTSRTTEEPTSKDSRTSTTEFVPYVEKRTESIVEFVKNETTVNHTINIKGCLDGEIWDECAIQCDQLCHYYEYTLFRKGICMFGGDMCVPGCRPINRKPCPAGHKWRDSERCVKMEDCTCRSNTGEIMKPGSVVKESFCKSCQCLSNHYTCDDTECSTTQASSVTEPPTLATLPTTQGIIIIQSTVTPPQLCFQDRFVPLIKDLPPSAFSASSIYFDRTYTPYNVRFNSLDGSWRPGDLNDAQYLQIDLGHADNVYGVIVKGDLVRNEFVKSFYILHSLDNVVYSYVTFHDIPQVFKGPAVYTEPVTQIFSTPVEARYVRINPLSWVGGPFMKIELLGCEQQTTTVEVMSTTTQVTSTSPPSVCTDKMSNFMNDQQIQVSSIKNAPLSASLVSVHSDHGWVTQVNDPNQWLQFDFLGKRTLTGITTLGSGSKTSQFAPGWVTAYTISFSHDGKNWNSFVDENGKKQIFSGNNDNLSEKTHIFIRPIHARYVRIHPTKWHNAIVLRGQMLGCYEPYPILTTTTVPTTTVRQDCNLCPGARLTSEKCPCSEQEWWDGEQCTSRTFCPCYIGFIPYAVGTTFDNEECEQCVCGMKGIELCKKKECPPCTQGLRSELTGSCGCVCKPCEAGTRLCPSSNICINDSSWCDGVVDCPDDEVNCTTVPPPTLPTTLATSTVLPTVCPPPVVCPPGTEAILVVDNNVETTAAPVWSPFGNKSKWGSYFKGNPRSRENFGARHKGWRGHKGGKTSHKGHKTAKPVKIVEEPKCPEIICKTKDCTVEKPNCPPGYDLLVKKASNEEVCDNYECVKIPQPDGKCNITGRTFTTFDGTEYKYDICDHIIARDRINQQWEIREIKTCEYIGPCRKHLLIKYDNHTIQLNSDLSITMDGYAYTVPQMQKIGSQSYEFAIKQVSNKFLLFSSTLDFTVIWDTQGNLKVIVPDKSKGEVDGLCGFFDGTASNDKQKPDGNPARTSVEFGDSWGTSTDCETKACPVHIQKEAFEMCKIIKEEPLSLCGAGVNLDKTHGQCVESICLCMESNNNTESCRCEAILEAVTECQGRLPEVDLSQWRMLHDCPVDCPEGLVYKECFTRACEPCCADLMLQDACPETKQCFPGCYCPDGYVRSFEKCVKPSECRDCKCEGYGNSRFVSFDQVDYTYNGNCTHVLAQTLENSSGPKFKALVTNGPCGGNPSETCSNAITILFKEHSVQAIRTKNKTIIIKIDGTTESLPLKKKWITVSEQFGKGISIHMPKIQLDLEMSTADNSFKLLLPSHLYFGKTEGLCGSCNLNNTDDFKMQGGMITEDLNKFGYSWLMKDVPSVLEKENQELCHPPVVEKGCMPPPPETDHCLKLMDEELFGKCHAVVDPSIFIANCHDAFCHGVTNECTELESYAKECQTEGICLEWRSQTLCPYPCPPGLEYQACGLGCTETCDNYELYRKSPDQCLSPRGDTCLCPTGQVVKNGTCTPESHCSPCDTEGHYPGDEWNPDTCTKCTCSKSSVQCERIQCTQSDKMCTRGFKSVAVKGTETDCCPQYVCVPEPTSGPTCPEPQQPKCGPGQIMKLEDSTGCQDFVCVCKPVEDCDDISGELSKERPPGMIAEVDNSSCCPVVQVNCRPLTCPPLPSCPPLHVPIKRDTEQCCPQYKCGIEEGKCLYEYEYMNSEKGGERRRKENEKESTLKLVGDVWTDGPCRKCECRHGSQTASCTTKICSTPPESENYVYKPEMASGKCCPIYKRVACKVGTTIYQIGETWQADGDRCKNCSCTVGSGGEVTKQDSVQSCKKDCPLGWSYSEPPSSSGLCCGECVPVGCVVNATVHLKDTTWQSSDNCTTYSCLIDNNQVQVVSSGESCPDVEDCPKDRLYSDGCCEKCNRTVVEYQSGCTTEPVALNATQRLVQIFSEEHGPCTNLGHILDFKECKGTCDSGTEYDWRTNNHESKCLCCQVNEADMLTISLECADGTTVEKQVSNPKSCLCTSCVGEFEAKKAGITSKKQTKHKL